MVQRASKRGDNEVCYLHICICKRRVTLMRAIPLSHQYPGQIINRTCTSICGAIAGRGTTIPLIAAIASLLVCCSSVSNTFTALFESSRNSSPPETPAAPVLSPPIADQIAPSPPSETPTSPTVPVATQAARTISDDFDAAASVYPSVAFFDEIRKSRDAQLSSQRLSPPNSSDSSAPATPSTTTSQPPRTTLPGSGPIGTAAPLVSAGSDEYDAAASVYPSVALFDLIRESRESQLSSQTASPPILSESSNAAAPAMLAGQRTQ
jgi:hypothetical protein